MNGLIMHILLLDGFVKFECPALSFVDLAGWTDGVILPDGWRCMIDLIMHFCLLDGFNRFEYRVPFFEDLPNE